MCPPRRGLRQTMGDSRRTALPGGNTRNTHVVSGPLGLASRSIPTESVRTFQSFGSGFCTRTAPRFAPGPRSSVLFSFRQQSPVAPTRPGGEIGRHKGLKIPRRKACRFESGPGHQAIDRSERSGFALFARAPGQRSPSRSAPLPRASPSFARCSDAWDRALVSHANPNDHSRAGYSRLHAGAMSVQSPTARSQKSKQVTSRPSKVAMTPSWSAD